MALGDSLGDKSLDNVTAITLSMQDLNAAMKSANKEAKSIGDAFKNVDSSVKEVTKSAEKFAKIQEDAKKSVKGTQEAVSEQQKNLETVRTLNSKINSLAKSTLSVDRERAKILVGSRDNAQAIADSYGEVANESAKLDKSTKFFSGLSEVVKDIPGLRKLSKPFEAASEAARKTVLSNAKLGPGVNKSSVAGKGLAAGFKSVSSSLGKGGAAGGIIFLIKKFIELSFKANVQVTKLGKAFSLTTESATALRKSLTESKGSIKSIYGTTNNLVEAYTQLSGLTEFVNHASNDQLQTQLQLTKQLGLSVDETKQLQSLFAVNNEKAEEGTDAVYDQVAAFANQNGLLASGKKIMQQIAKTSSLLKLNIKGGTKELANTILNANKLGLSLSQVDKVAGSLLDFESSISAEMEAELLTGRQLNLDKARTFALNNDIAGLTQEIAKQGITAEKFSSMNRIQQEAIAKALGMSASELADSLFKSKLIDKTSKQHLKTLRDEAKAYRDQGDAKAANAVNDRANAIEAGLYSGKTLREAELAVDAQTKFNLLITKMQEIFTDLIDGGTILRMVNWLERVVASVEGGRGLGESILNPTSEADVIASGRNVSQSLGPKEVEVNDFTIKTHPKDTLVMAGGTKLGGGNDEVVSLLKELVNRKGDVYLDGQKVGDVLSTSYRTMSN